MEAEPSSVLDDDDDVSFEPQPQMLQQSRKFRKVAIEKEEEPALNPEELEVLQSIGRSGLVLNDDDADNNISDDDDSCFNGFVESNLWEAQPTHSHALASLVQDDEEDPVPREFTMGSFYDSMFDANGGAYDSNYAYGTDIISDAEVLTALGYPQAPTLPSTKRPPVICYCGCRVDPSEANQHRYKCGALHGPRRGIYAGSNNLERIKEQRKALLEDKKMPAQQEDNNINMYCGSMEPMDMVSSNNNNMIAMGRGASSTLTPIDESWASPTPIQSEAAAAAAPQSGGHYGGNGMPFHVPESAPMARPRMYRSFHQNAF